MSEQLKDVYISHLHESEQLTALVISASPVAANDVTTTDNPIAISDDITISDVITISNVITSVRVITPHNAPTTNNVRTTDHVITTIKM